MTSMTGIPPLVPPPFDGVHAPDTDRWPGVIGTIAIIFGVAGVLQGGCGMVSSIFSNQMYELITGLVPQTADQLASQQEATERFTWMNTGLSLLSMLVAIMLLVGGIRLLRRRASSAALLRAWAGAKLILALLLAGAGWIAFQAQMELMQADQNAAGPSPAFIGFIGTLGVAFNLLWQWTLPIFMLVWFSRAPIRASVARWN